MRVVLATGFLDGFTGSEMVIRDLAAGLAARGHDVAVFAPGTTGAVRIGDVPVAGDPRDLVGVPDIIHGQHATAILPLWRHFPDVPIIQSIQDVSHPLDEPLLLPSIRHYVAVDDLRARRVLEAGIAAARITMIPNAVALGRFAPKPVHDRIGRALVVAKYHEGFAGLVRRAFGPAGVSVDALGYGAGGMDGDFPARLAAHDLLIGSGRCALEAAAMGLSVIVCDERGFAGALTRATWPTLRAGNFGAAAFGGPTTVEALAGALAATDPAEAERLRPQVRAEASLEAVVDSVAALHARVVAEGAGSVPAAAPEIAEVVYGHLLRLHAFCRQKLVGRDILVADRAITEAIAQAEIAGYLREIAAQEQDRQALRDALAEVQRAAVGLAQTCEVAQAALAEAQRAAACLERDVADRTAHWEDAEARAAAAGRDLRLVQDELVKMQASASWRVTEPLRRALGALGRR